MAKGNGTNMIAQNTRSKSDSLRTMMPSFVVKQLEIYEGDPIEWTVDKNKNSEVAIASKKIGKHDKK